MNSLKSKVINYLNMGLSPAIVGMKDNGLFYLFDELLRGSINSNGYDPTFTFIHVAGAYLPQITLDSLENEINNGLKSDNYQGNSIFETISNGVDVACVIDDISFLKNPEELLRECDILIRKYRQHISFVYIIEDPLLVGKFREKLQPSASIFDATIYQTLGDWNQKDLQTLISKQFKANLDSSKINEISSKSGNHFGIFKRLYKDAILNSYSIEEYITQFVESFSVVELNSFKKYLKDIELNNEESLIISEYEKVGLFENHKVKIPLLTERFRDSVIKNKIYIEDEKIHGLDLNLLTDIEREVVELLLSTSELVSREKLSEIIWKGQGTDAYSDWALDQRIARLRKKLLDLGFNLDIQTIYGKGFKIVKF